MINCVLLIALYSHMTILLLFLTCYCSWYKITLLPTDKFHFNHCIFWHNNNNTFSPDVMEILEYRFGVDYVPPVKLYIAGIDFYLFPRRKLPFFSLDLAVFL